jgi:phosphohistidine phosphatase SixA
LPVVAALNGDAIGGGAEFAVACDMRVARASVNIGYIHGKLGISSGWGWSGTGRTCGTGTMKKCISAAIVATLLGLVFVSGGARAGDELWTLLKGGGQVVLMRHAVTTPGVGDPPGMRLDDCATQRNLTDEGRRHARQTGDTFRTRSVIVDRVLASPWCRCLETARLAFSNPAESSEPLSNLFGRQENQSRQVKELQALVGKWHGRGNLVLVSHGSTILALTGVSPEPAEMVIVTPQPGEKFTVAGRLVAYVQ